MSRVTLLSGIADPFIVRLFLTWDWAAQFGWPMFAKHIFLRQFWLYHSDAGRSTAVFSVDIPPQAILSC